MEIRNDSLPECNYLNEPYELKADCYLARAEPVECIPGPDEKPSDELCSSKMLSMSMSTGATVPTDLLPMAERDPATSLRATTIIASTTAPALNQLRLLRQVRLL